MDDFDFDDDLVLIEFDDDGEEIAREILEFTTPRTSAELRALFED